MIELAPSQQNITQQLIVANTRSFVEAFQVEHIPILRNMLETAMRIPARRITQTILEYDASVHHSNLHDASDWFLKAFNTQVHALYVERIPRAGPVLFVSNHPGMTDAMAIFATMPRYDVKAVAKINPILSVLQGIKRHIIFVESNLSARITTFRAIRHQLNAGGAVLLYPAGEIEPDPALHQNGADTLAHWSTSLALFVKHVPQLQIIPVTVGGVISQTALSNPLVKVYTTQARREWVAATLMVIVPAYRNVCVTVRYGTPVTAAATDVMDAVIGQMRDMMAETWQQSNA
jgi:hypothetical protein